MGFLVEFGSATMSCTDFRTKFGMTVWKCWNDGISSTKWQTAFAISPKSYLKIAKVVRLFESVWLFFTRCIISQCLWQFRFYLISAHSMPLAQNRARNNAQTQNSDKNPTKLCTSKFREKSVDRKWHRPALTNEVRNRRSRGIFCRKDFCTNLLIHNLMRFLLNSSFTKFHLALFSVLSWLFSFKNL